MCITDDVNAQPVPICFFVCDILEIMFYGCWVFFFPARDVHGGFALCSVSLLIQIDKCGCFSFLKTIKLESYHRGALLVL